MTFDDFFTKSFSERRKDPPTPFPYQRELAQVDSGRDNTGTCTSRLIQIPTGLGKTAAVIHAWLWNRVHLQNDDWPRRLVICLPMRTLVEQTQREVQTWLEAHNLLWSGDSENHTKKVGLHLLMGGEPKTDWEKHPEENAILIGTQDMLVSRALNRGYCLNRFRWPFHFGLLSSDCLYVFDEIQLMGPALKTTAQLAAFNEVFGSEKPNRYWWMSATGDANWLHTVDFEPSKSLSAPISLSKKEKNSPTISKLLNASKSLNWHQEPIENLAEFILSSIAERPGLTLVILNTVDSARTLHQQLSARIAKKEDNSHPEPILLHSQFRPAERKRKLQDILAAEQSDIPQIAVTTQVIEAGVDLSATTLLTELAPWSSLIQRFGRCNRRGEVEDAQIHIFPAENALPYEDEQLAAASDRLKTIQTQESNLSPASLAALPLPDCDRPQTRHVIRKKDFLDLFDTTADLSGQDIDIDRWVRDNDDSKVQLFWRDWENAKNGAVPPLDNDFPKSPAHSELCPAPIGSVRAWLKKDAVRKKEIYPWYWDHLGHRWAKVSREGGEYQLIPGRSYLLPSFAGGYTEETGFDPVSKPPVPDCQPDSEKSAERNTSMDDELPGKWQSIAQHTDEVCEELANILKSLNHTSKALTHAARWHDLGKAHPAFQAKISPEEAAAHTPVGKAPNDAWLNQNDNKLTNHTDFRRGYRHELASALAVLQRGIGKIPDEMRDLVAWLIATHHGKVRLAIRALPKESLPKNEPSALVARGLWQDDTLPATELGGGITSPQVTLSLEPMLLGLCQEAPFEDQPSWIERMLTLRDNPELGPIRLAWWEALLRAADERASALAPTSDPS
jgi:CRISPR-associated endonuclease/helicase Cas3